MGNELSEEEKIQNGEQIKNNLIKFKQMIENTNNIVELENFLLYLQDAQKKIIEEEGVTYGTDEPAIYTKPKNYTHGYIVYILSEIHQLINFINNKRKQLSAGNNIGSIDNELTRIKEQIEVTNDIDELNNFKFVLEQLDLSINLVRDKISENELNAILFQIRETYSRLMAKMNFIDGLEENIRGINR